MLDFLSALRKIKLSPINGQVSSSGTEIHFYDYTSEGERSRIHLRIDAEGSGLLLVNASRIIHLNPTAAFMSFLILEKVPRDSAIRKIQKEYAVSQIQAATDYAQLATNIEELIKPDGACPIHDLDLEVMPPFSVKPSAPYRMDLALTYRCNNDCAHCYNDRPRDYAELGTSDWLQILDKLWQIGIPHVVFTGGEPTLRDDLPELIAHAERNGQITGINTNGRRLSDRKYLDSLVTAGLDHVQVTFESSSPDIHDAMVRTRGAWKQTVAGIQHVLETPLYMMTNTTMLRDNCTSLEPSLEFLASLGVPTIGLNALIYSGKGTSVKTGLSESELAPLLDRAREITDKHHQRLIWYTPTQYCNFDPMQLELGVKGCSAALYNMCIESNGDVIPCQSYYQSLGNFLTHPWAEIWNHPRSVSLRERKSLPQKCSQCALLAECGGGCPLVQHQHPGIQ